MAARDMKNMEDAFFDDSPSRKLATKPNLKEEIRQWKQGYNKIKRLSPLGQFKERVRTWNEVMTDGKMDSLAGKDTIRAYRYDYRSKSDPRAHNYYFESAYVEMRKKEEEQRKEEWKAIKGLYSYIAKSGSKSHYWFEYNYILDEHDPLKRKYNEKQYIDMKMRYNEHLKDVKYYMRGKELYEKGSYSQMAAQYAYVSKISDIMSDIFRDSLDVANYVKIEKRVDEGVFIGKNDLGVKLSLLSAGFFLANDFALEDMYKYNKINNLMAKISKDIFDIDSDYLDFNRRRYAMSLYGYKNIVQMMYGTE